MNGLRQFIRLLIEAKPQQAVEDDSPGTIGPTDNLALYINSSRHNTIYVLYDPEYYASKMRSEIEQAHGQFQSISMKGDDFNDFEDFYGFANVQDIFRDSEGVHGYIVVNMGRSWGIDGLCNDANEVRVIASRPGYGTLMYLVAMVNDSPIMPSRSSISPSDRVFWKYFDSEKGKLHIEKFSDETKMHPKTSQDCSVYGDKEADQSYSLKTDYNLSTLQTRHKAFISNMEKYFKTHGVDFIKSRVQEYLLDSGKRFYELEAKEEELDQDKQE